MIDKKGALVTASVTAMKGKIINKTEVEQDKDSQISKSTNNLNRQIALLYWLEKRSNKY